MDGGNDRYINYRPPPTCQQLRIDLSRVTARDLLCQIADSITSLRNDFPGKFVHLEDIVQGESNDWKEILEDIGKSLESLQQYCDDIQQGQEGKDGIKAILSNLEEQIADLQVGQDRLANEVRPEGDTVRSQIELLQKTIDEGLRAQAKAYMAKTKVLSTEIQLLRRCMDMKPRFPQFMRLPPEIRFMIWDLALPRKILCVEETDRDTEEHSFSSYQFAPSSLPPSVAQVCRESRAVACRTGRLMPIRNSNVYPRDLTPGEMPSWCRTQWVWFDPRLDSLYLRPLTDQLRSLEAILELTRYAQHVTLDGGSTNTRWPHLFHRLFSPYYFPRLKAVDLVGGLHVVPERSDPVLETRLFGCGRNYPFSIDIDDEVAKDALMKGLRRNHSSVDVDNLGRFLDNVHRVTWSNTPHHNGVEWKSYSACFSDEWFLAQYNWSPLGGGGDATFVIKRQKRPGLSNDWFFRMMPNFPVIRRVALLRLGFWNS
ncbi:hypothetical protein F5Y05DRAFT_411924 [Hypoxylon sp. FL0543]|nr:hypothetical protein F5Y05DRAFT_411924 [Hypoxylon sp. FL0543]